MPVAIIGLPGRNELPDRIVNHIADSCSLRQTQGIAGINKSKEMILHNLNIVGPGEVVVGNRTQIAPDVQFIFHVPSRIEIGDHCVIGSGVKFVCSGGDVLLGDWTTIHDRSLVLSTIGVEIGQHCWFGQNCILDGSGGLTIGNGVRVGMYSQIWSHVAAGEQIEGCTLFGERPVVVEDDVWLVGSCIVASGVTIGRRSVALIASNITKSHPENTVLAGSPAQPKPALQFYKAITLDEKWAMLGAWLIDIANENNLDIVEHTNSRILLAHQKDGIINHIAFAFDTATSAELCAEFPSASVCNLETKTYVKRLSDIEAVVLKSLAGNKARFLTHSS